MFEALNSSSTWAPYLHQTNVLIAFIFLVLVIGVGAIIRQLKGSSRLLWFSIAAIVAIGFIVICVSLFISHAESSEKKDVKTSSANTNVQDSTGEDNQIKNTQGSSDRNSNEQKSNGSNNVIINNQGK